MGPLTNWTHRLWGQWWQKIVHYLYQWQWQLEAVPQSGPTETEAHRLLGLGWWRKGTWIFVESGFWGRRRRAKKPFTAAAVRHWITYRLCMLTFSSSVVVSLPYLNCLKHKKNSYSLSNAKLPDWDCIKVEIHICWPGLTCNKVTHSWSNKLLHTIISNLT